jgi:DNA-binding transcriptional LysR family regulator
MDKLSVMHTFRRIVELGSFKAAADERGLSNAAVSKQLKELEQHLGAALLTRTTRRLSQTELGQAYYQHCVQVLDDIASVEGGIAASMTSPRGLLRICAPMAFGLTYLSPLVSKFMLEYPQVTLDLVLKDGFVNLADDGFDLALRLGSTLPDASFVAKRLGAVKHVLCASPAYLLAYGVPASLDDLRHHRTLVYRHPEDASGEWTFLDGGQQGHQNLLVGVKVEPVLTVNNSMALRDALLAGVGLSLIAYFVVKDDIEASRLVPLLPEYAVVSHAMHIVYPSNRQIAPKVKAFVDFLISQDSGTSQWADS